MSTKTQKSLFHNSILNLIKTFCGIAFPVITFSYAARILGEEGIGRVTFAKSIITYFSMLALLGMDAYGTREAAKRRADRRALSKFVHEMLLINSCTTAIAYILLLFTVLLVPKLQGYANLLLICSAAIVMKGMGLEWLYQGLEEYGYIAWRTVIFQIGAMAAMLLFVRRAGDTVAYAVITVTAAYGAYVLNFINARKYIDVKWYGHYNLRKHLRPLLWLFAMAVSIELYTVLDSTMLGFLQGDAVVGRYTAASKVNKMVISVISAVSTVLIPRLSFYIGQGNREKVEELVNKAYNYIFMLAVPAAVGLFMLSEDIIRLFSGISFRSSALTMRLLTPIVLVIPFSAATNQQTFVPMGKEKRILISTCVGAVTNFICNAILIPRYAENGAAIGTVVAEMAVGAVCFFNAKKYFDMKAVFKKHYQYWFAALPIPVIVTMTKSLPVHYIGQMAVAIIVSAACYFVLLYWQRNDYLQQALLQLLRQHSL